MLHHLAAHAVLRVAMVMERGMGGGGAVSGDLISEGLSCSLQTLRVAPLSFYHSCPSLEA